MQLSQVYSYSLIKRFKSYCEKQTLVGKCQRQKGRKNVWFLLGKGKALCRISVLLKDITFKCLQGSRRGNKQEARWYETAGMKATCVQPVRIKQFWFKLLLLLLLMLFVVMLLLLLFCIARQSYTPSLGCLETRTHQVGRTGLGFDPSICLLSAGV